MLSEIKSFSPFFATWICYCGSHVAYCSFTCPVCGSHDVFNRHDPHFFQGHFKCANCACDCDDDGPLYYASSCFHVVRENIAQQLTLF